MFKNFWFFQFWKIGICWVLAVMFFSIKNLQAQPTDTLPQALVTAARTQFFAAGQKKTTFDSTQLAALPGQKLAQILQQNSTLALKSYGAAALTNPSQRGAGAEQTAILWQGFDLRSNMNGQSDLQLAALAATDEITLQAGAPVAVSGAGALGGAIFLETKTDPRLGWHSQISAGLGSWGEQFSAGKFSFSDQKIAVGLRGWQQRATNDYPVRGGTASGSKFLENARARSLGWLPQAKFFLSEKQSVEVLFWQQWSRREIPPSRVAAVDSAFQLDDFQRLAAVWSVVLPQNWLVRTRVGRLHEQIFFENLVERNQRSRAVQTVVESEAQRGFGKIGAVNFGVHLRRDEARLPEQTDKKTRNRAAAWAAWRKKWSGGGTFSLAARQEIVESRAVPFTFSTGAELPFFQKFRGKISLARNFNLPTFNQLFWPLLGNPNLRPESGWSGETGLVFLEKNRSNSRQFSAELTHFQIFTKDWVQWQPGSDGLFRPRNLLSVWSRGGEASLRFGQNFSKNLQAKIEVEYALTHATRTDFEEPAEHGKQLPYLPRHQFLAAANFSWKNGSARWSQRWSSLRHTDPTNLSDFDLPVFGVADFSLAQRLPFFQKLVVQAGMSNVFDRRFELIAFRPMAGRGWRVAAVLNF